MPYRHTEKPLRTIGQELGASAIVEGSVQRVGNDVRITAQLIDARTDRHLWSARYDRRLEDVFAMQSDIAKAIAGALEAELAPGVEERIERAPTDDLVAYELYLHGRDYFSRGTKEESKTATDLLEQAIARDPNFALARAALAKVYARDAWAYGGEAWQADSALAEAERAAALTPDLADAHAALGRAHMAAGRFTKASAAYERAIELNPNDWGAVNDLAIVYLQTGRLAAAIQQWKRVLKGNPASAHGVRFNLALAHRVLGLLDRAEQGNRAALALKPDHVLAIVNQGHVDLFQGDTAAVVAAADRLARDHRSNPYALQSAGWLLIFVGQPEQARAPLERAYALSPTASGEGYVRVRLGYALWETGERERAAQLFEAFERFANEQIEKGNEYAMLPYSLAAAHAAQGETEQALEWLEQAVDRGWPYELTTVNDPLLASLRGDARFQTLVDRMRARNAEMRQWLAQAEGRKRVDWRARLLGAPR
jgi:protein kinase/serine/threonine-protein kinase